MTKHFASLSRRLARWSRAAKVSPWKHLIELLHDQLGPVLRGMFYTYSRKPHPYAYKDKEPAVLRNDTFKAFFHANGSPTLFWNAPAQAMMLEIEVDRGLGFEPLVITGQEFFSDEHPLPRSQTKWQYRARPEGGSDWIFSASVIVPQQRFVRKSDSPRRPRAL